MARPMISAPFRLERPAPLPQGGGRLRAVAPDLWLLDRSTRMRSRLEMPVRMSVVRLSGGDLWLHAPLWLDAETRADLDALGPVRFLVAPNPFHYLWLGAAREAYPQAEVHAAPGVAAKLGGLPVSRELGDEPPAAWRADLDQLVVRAAADFAEVVFLHRKSGTLLLTDLAFNIRQARRGWHRLAFRAMGVWGHFGPSRMARSLVFRDPPALRAALEALLDWDFQRIVMAHGAVVEGNAREEFRAGFARQLRG